MYASDLKHRDASLQQKLQNLYALGGGRAIDLSFRAPYLDLLKKLGSPHLNLPPVIHVAGTNGKGSTIATLKSMLEAGGYKVHAYTSPHLVEFNERIYLAGKNINDAALENLIDEVMALNAGNEITFFEITTALGFAAFSRTPADILLLEVGMGGRLDCTNVIENPLCTVLTATGLDHMEHLGPTIEKIAAEKAGIIKPGAPVIVAPQKHAAAREIFEKTAREKNATLIHAIFDEKFPLPNLPGAHQSDNAGTAIAALRAITEKFPLSDAAITKGLQNITWPARLQNITAHFNAPAGTEIWLDGAHNEDAAQSLAAHMQNWNRDGKNTYLIFGMMQGRQPRAFLDKLTPHITSLHLVGIPGEPKAQTPDDIERTISGAFQTHKHASYAETIADIIQSDKNARILITGSLYLAGHVLKTAGN